MNQAILILAAVFGIGFLVSTAILFVVSRRSQKVMESLLMLLTRPERAKIADAARVLHIVLSDEIGKIESNFTSMTDALRIHVDAAEKLKSDLGVHNENLVSLADVAAHNMSELADRLDNAIGQLQGVVESKSWKHVSDATEGFASRINELLNKVDITADDAVGRTAQIQSQIEQWIDSGGKLSEQLRADTEKNIASMELVGAESHTVMTKLGQLSESVAAGFDNVKASASDYETLMQAHDKNLAAYIQKMDTFTKQSKTLLSNQVNTLTSTANVVGGQVRLAESSIEKQVKKLAEAVDSMMGAATATENSVRNVSGELSGLTNRFNGEIKEFSTSVVGDLQTVSGVANTTLENTRNAAGAFGESVRAMASGVRETLIEMNAAHQQLSEQSGQLIKMSNDTTAQLQPLSELIEKYYAALPELSSGSAEMAANLNGAIQAMSESITGIAESSRQLETLAGGSRQQMIDLMSDYAKAVDTMQTLNKQMMVARATAPMDAIANAAPVKPFAKISSADFIRQSEKVIAALHEQSLDLTRSIGAQIPDTVLKKYHAGDGTIFTKWLAKMLGAADARRVRETLKSDKVFRSQAAQFIRAFDRMLTVAGQSDDSERMSAALLKTDLGIVYNSLKGAI